MNGDFVAAIDKAAVAHATLRVRLLDAARGKRLEFDLRQVQDCGACEFGEWLERHRPELSSHPEYSAVRADHALFHMDVEDSLEKLRAGRCSEVERELQIEDGFRRKTERLILDLRHWRDRLASST